ncbi:SUMF1/EgtB/PvdO family nonheme iron enzyme [Marivibrio halodurans]|uniref:SUMF1/EgtB/PvdO family nonheme iron enzyme n=1 Tax=Marivibrio halodurans TaxID=2039722 RepID=A0A8J7S001_9PROT|nr:SUMF1/EgtB/PvdO family nonheme iron enzyme [Marivibrio halodurans]MBP5857765.1 SUMF1/EgtB/PvdO family nonheme iron enzyme [Marivibrio halodurans]
MVPIPAGTFTMGRDGGRRAGAPAHRAVIDHPFAMARTETTFAQYAACVEDGGCPTLPWDRDWGRGARPVIYVTHAEATAYAAWLAARTGRPYRLPSEMEWEYAALGGAPAPGIAPAPGEEGGEARVQCSGCRAEAVHGTVPAGSLPPNGYGLHEMLGNVMEWTADCWRPDHSQSAVRDCTRRTRKGGSWYFDRTVSIPAYRAGGRLTHKAYDVGFRVAVTLGGNR